MERLKKYDAEEFDNVMMTLFPPPEKLLMALDHISQGMNLAGSSWRKKDEQDLVELDKSTNPWCSEQSKSNLTAEEKLLISTLNKLTEVSYSNLIPDIMECPLKRRT